MIRNIKPNYFRYRDNHDYYSLSNEKLDAIVASIPDAALGYAVLFHRRMVASGRNAIHYTCGTIPMRLTIRHDERCNAYVSLIEDIAERSGVDVLIINEYARRYSKGR